jgi:hypothetical protein
LQQLLAILIKNELDLTLLKKISTITAISSSTSNPPPAVSQPISEEDSVVEEENCSDEVFCKIESTADLDATGRFPIPSLARNEYQLLSVFNNYIHIEPLRSRNHSDYIIAYDNTIKFWAAHGFRPKLLRLDNETSIQLEQFLDQQCISHQYFPTGQHRSNRAERAIRTWKNHFLSVLSTVATKFPLQLWDKLIPQAELTLNCLLPWSPNPSISSYHGLNGSPFDFRAHPIAPAGTAILIHDKPDVRKSWAPHGHWEPLVFILDPPFLITAAIKSGLPLLKQHASLILSLGFQKQFLLPQ